MPLQTFTTTNRTIDPHPTIRTAGIHSNNDPATAKQCFTHTTDNTFIRTATPSSLHQLPLNSQLYRKTQPGVRYIHGVHNTDAITTIDPTVSHGIAVSKGNIRAGDTLTNAQFSGSELSAYIQQQRERIYASSQRPIGRATVHKYIAPVDPAMIHGITSDSSESAKNLIYTANEQGKRFVDPLKADVDITKRIDRQYVNTTVNIYDHRHGKQVERKALNSSAGVSGALDHTVDKTVIGSQREQQVRYLNSKPIGSVVRTVELPPDFAAGARVKFDPVGTYDCIRGSYTSEQQAPDQKVGRPISTVDKLRPRSTDMHTHTADPSTIYGLPSIRHDLVRAPARRSVASEVNYGDESDAAQLIRPYEHAYSGVDETDLLQECTREFICRVYNGVGLDYSINDPEFNVVCDTAVGMYGVLSVDSFRHAYNRLYMNDENLNNTQFVKTQNTSKLV